MIILGERHHFSKPELEHLRHTFDSIDRIIYKDTRSQEVISQITSQLSRKPKSLIVLNTLARIPDKLLSYLVHLETRGITYISIEHFLERYLHKCYIPEDQTDITFLEDIAPYSKTAYIFKRLIDYGGIVAIALFSWPLMLYTLRQIKKESPGKAIFQQDRVGFKGGEFTCYKLRSMCLDAEKGGAKFAEKDDPRIFPWGHTMRKTRIDELPQLWNILRGDMHLIGPRPERRYWIEQFEKEIPYYHARHIVRPGITEWAQVNYPYGANTEDAHQKLMYDLYYIKYWSPWLEIKTVWRTIGVMLGKKEGVGAP